MLPIGALGSLPCPFTEDILGAQAFTQLRVANVLVFVLEKHLTISP